MIDLLTSGQKRRLQFILTLAHANDWMTLKELSELTRSSTRVLQDDIAFF